VSPDPVHSSTGKVIMGHKERWLSSVWRISHSLITVRK